MSKRNGFTAAAGIIADAVISGDWMGEGYDTAHGLHVHRPAFPVTLEDVSDLERDASAEAAAILREHREDLVGEWTFYTDADTDAVLWFHLRQDEAVFAGRM